MTYTEGDELRLDNRLDELAAGVVNRIRFDPPELKSKLQPPHLSVYTGPPGLNSGCVPIPGDKKIILMGADLYPFSHHYTRAAATYLLPSEPGGPRPSSFWPDACSAVATTLDWLASPAPTPLYPEFKLSQHQAHVARAFGDYAYRFALCHEMAHVALEHVDADSTQPKRVGSADIEVFRASQKQELIADRFGLSLQVKSLPDDSQLVTALASAIYFVHITGLLDLRLMLLRDLVDWDEWEIAYTHPPALHRIGNLMGGAEGLCGGAGAGLQIVHESLDPLDGELRGMANKQQEEVASDALTLIDAEVARITKVRANNTHSGSGPGDKIDAQEGNLPPEVAAQLLRLFNRSPLGVLLALEAETSAGVGQEEYQLRSFVKEQLASALPDEFHVFRHQTRARRAKELA